MNLDSTARLHMTNLLIHSIIDTSAKTTLNLLYKIVYHAGNAVRSFDQYIPPHSLPVMSKQGKPRVDIDNTKQ